MTERYSRRLVIVGGGLAGVAAAVEAARTGQRTCVVEQRPSLRAPPRLLADFAASGAETWLDTAAWGIWSHDLALCGPGGQSWVLEFEQLIVATGAFERPVAFPGWTLPGVMTLGSAIQLLEQGVPAGDRVLLAGYGSVVKTAAAELLGRGVRPVDVLDAAARDGRLVVRAEGEGRVERAVIAEVETGWYARPGTEHALEVDAIVLAFGSIPEDRLARLAGAEFVGNAYVDPSTARDAWMRSSVPGVLVAGDAGCVVGADAAVEQGRLAGLAAAVDGGCLGPEEADRRARSIQQRLLRLTSGELRPEEPQTGLFALAKPDTIVCRCENVTAEQIAERIFEGNIEPASVIAETRAGMGLCQGRNCASLIAATIARHAHVPLHRIPPITPRPPIVPVPLGVLAERPPVFPPPLDLSAAR